MNRIEEQVKVHAGSIGIQILCRARNFEAGNFKIAIVGKHQTLRRQIAMDETFGVRMIERECGAF